MNSEKQAVRVLAENLAQAVKKASSQKTVISNRSDVITASKIVGLPSALSSIISSVEGSAASGDAVAQQTLEAIQNIANGNFETITVDTAMMGRLYATFSDFITMVAQDAHIGDLDVENINAQLAKIGLADIGTAKIDMAQIIRSSTQTAFIHESVQGQVYIDDLAVSEASIVNLAAGTLLLNDTSGNLVELYVDEEGNVSTRQTSYNGDDIINSESLDGSRIIRESITTDRLNVNEIFAENEKVMNLIADNIDASRIRTGYLDAGVVKIINLTASDIFTDIIKSSDYEVVESPFVYPASNLYPKTVTYPSNGTYVRRGFAIDFSNGQVYGGLYSATTDDLQDQINNITPTSIGALPTAGGTMSGDIDMGQASVTSSAKSIIWKTADDTMFYIRPYNDVFQIVRRVGNNSYNSLGFKSDGSITMDNTSGWRSALSVYSKAESDALVRARMWSVRGNIVRSASTGTAVGYGKALVYIVGETVIVDFEAKITTAGTKSDVYNVGIQVGILRSLNPDVPSFNVLNGGIIHYFQSDGTMDTGMEGYAGEATFDTSGNYWTFARIYNTSGSIGAWADSSYTVGKIINGRLYGTI